MVSKILEEIPSEPGEVFSFYAGKTIFITGASGFLGTVLLEKLLIHCPDISKIYILLRPKKGISVEDRKEKIFQKNLFDKLKEINPDVMQKVIAIPGDTSQDDLGLNENDYNTLTKEVSVVFHIAAAISFTKKIGFIVRQNVIATNAIIDLCRKMQNLEVLVYTSTAYSNTNHQGVIEEKIYDLPFAPEELIKYGRENKEDEMWRLYNMCNPPFPNCYTFSKCVSENLIQKKAHDLPVCIIRPSIILACIRGSVPGYLEPGAALINTCYGVGYGIIRVVLTDKDKRVEMIPADVTANTHIVAAAYQVTKRLPSPTVYNCVADKERTVKWSEYTGGLLKMVRDYPLPHSYVCPFVISCKTRFMYDFLCLLLHYIPAVIVDLILWISGSKLSLRKKYKFYDKAMYAVEYFSMNEWEMKNENFLSLSKGLSPEEEEAFSMDLKDFKFEKAVYLIPVGASNFHVNGKPYREKFYRRCMRYFLTFLFAILYIGGIVSLLSLVFSKIFP